MNSSLSGGGTEHSIVSFGLNFNFDSTSSPSTSDSGEGAVHDGKGCGVEEGSNSDDDNNGGGEDAHGDAMCDDTPGGASSGAVITAGGEEDERKKRNPHHHKHHRRPEEIGEDGDVAKKTERTASVRFLPGAATDAAAFARGKSGEEEGSSTSSGSDSSMNDIHGGNASGGSNSGNEGSSGGKSTISTLTTSSNQEWMAAQNECSGAEGATGSADAQAVSATIVSSEAKTSRSTAQVTWDNGVEGMCNHSLLHLHFEFAQVNSRSHFYISHVLRWERLVLQDEGCHQRQETQEDNRRHCHRKYQDWWRKRRRRWVQDGRGMGWLRRAQQKGLWHEQRVPGARTPGHAQGFVVVAQGQQLPVVDEIPERFERRSADETGAVFDGSSVSLFAVRVRQRRRSHRECIKRRWTNPKFIQIVPGRPDDVVQPIEPARTNSRRCPVGAECAPGARGGYCRGAHQAQGT